jgi:hypothetical protein
VELVTMTLDWVTTSNWTAIGLLFNGRDGLRDAISAATAPELPSLDSTGKVHGDLPKAEDLGRYSGEELTQLQQELRQSVKKRIEVTNRLGPEKKHGERQAAEQQLIRQIDRHLRGR